MRTNIDPSAEEIKTPLFDNDLLSVTLDLPPVPPPPKWEPPIPPLFKNKVSKKGKRHLGIWDAYEWLNERHFVVSVSGKTWVANVPRSEEESLTFSSFEMFEKRYNIMKAETVEVVEEVPTTKVVTPAGMWLEWENRPTKTGVILDPSKHGDPHAHNLWQGFGVKPEDVPWPVIEWHLRYIICSGHRAHYDWLIGWLARAVQHPEKQGETAIVLRGLKGAGKGLFAKMLKRIFGRHCFHATTQENFLSRFNGHLMDRLFLFADEATWAGDKRSEGRLKAMITEDELAFEGKYQPTMMMPNRLKVVMASNEDWVVPATFDERRFLVLTVSSQMLEWVAGKEESEAYFTTLANAVDGPELAGFLAYLLRYDISKFDHRRPPHTEGLNSQKVKSLRGFDRFWFERLGLGNLDGVEGWPKMVSKSMLYDTYKDRTKERVALTPSEVGTRMWALVPGLTDKRPTVDDGQQGGRVWVLPSLEECRLGFEKAHRMPGYDWG